MFKDKQGDKPKINVLKEKSALKSRIRTCVIENTQLKDMITFLNCSQKLTIF